MDRIAKSLENGELVIGTFLDFSKTFDTVNHDVLLQKLQHYGIRGSALKWFQSYLSDRCQYVKYNLQISIDGHSIDETDDTKFLGVIIDSKLNGTNHISYITGKIARGIGVITKARKLLDKETLITLYYTFIYPCMCYCNHVWGNTYVTYLEKLFLMQKKIVRIIHGVRPRTGTKS